MEEKILEKMINNLVEEAGPIAIENMVKDDLEALEVSDVKFSKKHEEKMKKIFAEARRQQTMPKKVSVMRRVAVVFVAVMLLSGLTITSVDAWRESFAKYFLEMKEEYSIINKQERDSDIIVDNIHFKYVPAGYKFDEKIVNSHDVCISFVVEDRYFTFQNQESNWNTKTNTESGDISDLVINDKDMVYSENDRVKVLTWYENGNVCTVHTNDTKDMLIKFVEGIEFLN